MSLNNLEGNVVKKAHVHSQRILLNRILTKTTTIKITEHAPAEVLHNGHLCNVAATWTTRKKRCKMNLNSLYISVIHLMIFPCLWCLNICVYKSQSPHHRLPTFSHFLHLSGFTAHFLSTFR